MKEALKNLIDQHRSDTVIISRHQGLVDLLKEYGIEGRVVQHATSADVEGKLVIGNLPFDLASLAVGVITPDLSLPFDLRGKELTADQMKPYLTGFSGYRVSRIG